VSEKLPWGLLALVLGWGLLLLGWRLSRPQDLNARQMALVSVLATVAGISRVPFAAIPSLQPTTALIVIIGSVFGSRAGFLAGSGAALISNFFLGQGPWTLWQMLFWGLIGAGAGLLAGPSAAPTATLRRLTVYAFLAGYAFGWGMNFWSWLAFFPPPRLLSLILLQTASLGLDSLHAVGNVFFIRLLAPSLLPVLRRYQAKSAPAQLSLPPQS